MAAAAGGTFLHNAAGALWTTQSKAAAEAAALTTSGVGMGLWQWNRGYYAYDSRQRWARFNFINNMAIAQTGQYREDIEDLASLTSNRMDNYHILGCMALTIATALFCPGRLGLHMPPPPSWLMGLFMTNLAAAYLWLAMTMWMAMHASLRADSAACHMLTRMVRLPVPSQRQLDRARRLFSSWEYQNFGELFRVPFLQKHARKGHARVTGDEPPEDAGARDRTRCEFDVPAWFRKERDIDEGRPVESFMPRTARGNAPEHFEVFRVIQNEYWAYDVYARLSMFLAWMHLTDAWGHYQIGHTVMETRAIFAGCIVPVPLMVAQHVMMTLDIVTPQADFFPWHRLGPLSMLFCLIANVLEHKRWYTESGLYISGFFVFLAYASKIIFTLQMLRLSAPNWDKVPEAHESPGAAWWPAKWRLPSAWSHSVWLLGPPKEKCFGENDIVDELRKSSTSRRGETANPTAMNIMDSKKDDVHSALVKDRPPPAWFFVRSGLQVILFSWVWLTFGYFVDLATEGTVSPSLFNAPGLPNNLRDPRNRGPKPGYLCVEGPKGECLGQETGLGGYYAGPAYEQIHKQLYHEKEGKGFHRRLMSKAHQQLAEKIRDLLPYLQHVIRDRDDSEFPAFGVKQNLAIGSAAELVPAREDVKWPALFEPRLLACGPRADGSATHMAAALSRHGRGAIVTSTDDLTETTPFVLEGAALFGPFLAAHWDKAGLMLTTSTGGLLECPGAALAGRWHCRPLAAEKLPIGLGAKPFNGALAVARRTVESSMEAAPELLSAVAFPGDDSVAIFRRAGRENAPWLPAGEVRTPSQVFAAAFDDNADSLLMLLADGAVVKMRLSDGVMALTAEAVTGPAHTWQATCGLTSSKVARLGVRPSGPASFEPSLIFGV